MASKIASSLLLLSSLLSIPATHALPSSFTDNFAPLKLFQRADTTNPSSGGGTSASSTNSTSTSIAGLISSSSASGGKNNSTTDSVNCNDLTTGVGSSCFSELGIAQYAADWAKSHECYPNEGFSTCFYRQSGLSGLNCAGISLSGCPAPQLPGTTDPKMFYLAWEIYAINSFFTTWNQAVINGARDASDNIGDIATLISPTNSTSGTNMLTSRLGLLSRSIQSNLNQTVVSVLSNVTLFNAFASQGNFTESTRTPSYLSDATNYLYFAFNTYITSSLLKSNGIYAAVEKGTDVHKLATNGTHLAYPIDCKMYDENDVCDTFYFSTALNSSFGLISTPSPQQNLASLTSTLLSNYTTGPLLFDASYQCGGAGAQNGTFGGPANVTVTAQGVNTACISQLQVFTWDKACHANPSDSGDGPAPGCEFLEREKDASFWVSKGGVKQVPAAYLGPALSQQKVKVSRTS